MDATAERAAKKELSRVERQLTKHNTKIAAVHALMVQHASDYETLATLDQELVYMEAERDRLELEWFHTAEQLDA